MQQIPMIKFKLTNLTQQTIELAFEEKKTIGQYIDDLSELFDVEAESFKLVFKGKILTWKQNAEEVKIKNGTVMVVVNSSKKSPKKVVASKDQVVPGAGMSTGLGASSPFGVGGYQVVNHPQYMSAISSAVDPDKMQQILDDPQYQGMMEQMLEDPDTLRQLMNQNPMLRNMLKDNPGLKMMMENPALMKMMFNKDMLKKTAEAMKKGGSTDPEDIAKNLQGEMGLGGTGGVGTVPMAGQNTGLGMNQSNFGSFGNFMNPMMNPMMMQNMNNMNNFQSNQNGQGNQPQGQNPQQQGNMPNLQSLFQNSFWQRTYAAQLKQLQQYGFSDRAKNLKILREVKGDIEKAMEKLCSDD